MAELRALGRYTLQRVLGKGAMGIVYEGLDPKLNRRVAIKTIHKSHLDNAAASEYSERFMREAQAVARLNHPNIVQVHDFGQEGDVAYLVMEFIRGKELKAYFDAKQAFDVREAVRIMGELLDALDFAHQAGVIHRDVKPANVMLDSQTRVKLADFGVARIQDSGLTHASQGTMVGTPAYMSPEQISGRIVDGRTDVFAAGIILYEFLTSEQPFAGGGAWTVAARIMQQEPPQPSSINAAIAPLFDDVVKKALAKNADLRYRSAREFSIALRRALEGTPVVSDADKTVLPLGTLAPQPARQRQQAPTPEEQQKPRKRPAPLLWGLASLAAVAVASAAWLLRPAKPDENAAQKAREAELVKLLGSAKQRESELIQAKEREAELRKEAEVARLREAAEQAKQNELEAVKQIEVMRQRELDAKKQADAEAARRAAAERDAQRAEAARQAAERAAAERAAAEKVAAERAAAEQAALAAAERATAQQRLAAAKPAAPQHRPIGRVVEVFPQFGYVVFRLIGADVAGSTVYVKSLEGAFTPMRIERRRAELVSAVPVGGGSLPSMGTEVFGPPN